MLSHFRRNETLLIICIETVIMMTGLGLMGPILPQYVRTFDASITMIGLVVAMFGVARIFTDIPAGRLAGKLGCRPVLIAGPIFMVIGSVGCGLAGSYWILMGFRFIQGLGSALYTTAAYVAMANISKPDNRGQILGLLQGSILLGAGIGPMIGGFVAQYFGIQAPFFVMAALAALAALWGYIRIPRDLTGAPAVENSDSAATAVPAAGKSTTVTGVLPLLKNFNYMIISLVTFGVFFLRSGAQSQILPLIGSDRLGLSEGSIGIAMTVASIIQLVTILIGGKLSDNFGRKIIITAGCLIAVVSLVVLAQSYSYALLIGASILMGIGTGISGSAPVAYVADIVPRENYGSCMGLNRTIGDLGFVVGPILLGWLADNWGYSVSLYFNAIFLFISIMIFQILAREPLRKRQKTVKI